MARMGEHGQGTIVPLPNGTYRVTITMANGRRVWRRARTDRDAKRIRRELVEARELELDPSRQTLADFLRSWISSLRDARHARIRPRTLDHYALIVDHHIIPALGSLPLTKVTERRVQAWLDADGGAARTIHHHRAVLRRALNVALRQRLIPRNPALAVELPRVRVDVARPLTLDEARALLTATAKDRLHALWRLALVSGLRQGELLGLGWDDLDGSTLTVSTQLQRLVLPAEREAAKAEGRKPRGTWARSAPKAARTLPAIALDPVTVDVLEAHQLKQAAERGPTWRYFGLMFITTGGEPYHQAEIGKAFKAACLRAGIEPRRFHDIRGSTATLMAEVGVPEPVRMSRLGHATTRMARKYAQVREAADRDAVERLSEALG